MMMVVDVSMLTFRNRKQVPGDSTLILVGLVAADMINMAIYKITIELINSVS